MSKVIVVTIYICLCAFAGLSQTPIDLKRQVENVLHDDILEEARWALEQLPVTVTDQRSPRSAGTIHDFYSEGDYWWPDSTDANAPYVQRDGQTNPKNFSAHRLAVIRLSKIIGALASAYLITHDDKYVRHALLHYQAWFINATTMMNASLNYAQAIKGRVTGRGIGIIDAIQFMEVAQGALVMQHSPAFDAEILTGIKRWFTNYLKWITTNAYGIDEMNAKNNHGTCWVMQVASFAKLTNNDTLLTFCSERYKTILLPAQMEVDGSFPLELKRTKPYGYSIFTLDAMTMICQILSNGKNDLWNFTTADGKSIHKGIAFLYSYLRDKESWPYQHDVMYWSNWPVAQPALVFGGLHYNNVSWLKTWKQLDHHPDNSEVVRNLPVRHPLLWLN